MVTGDDGTFSTNLSFDQLRTGVTNPVIATNAGNPNLQYLLNITARASNP